MFIYTGSNENSKHAPIIKSFEDQNDAETFANDNSIDYPEFKIIDDETDDEIYNNKIAQQIIDDTWDDMLPEDEDKENFDVNTFFEE